MSGEDSHMYIDTAIETIKRVAQLHEVETATAEELNALVDAAQELVAAYEYAEWLRLRRAMQHQI